MDDCGLELVLKPIVGPLDTGTNASICQFHQSEMLIDGGGLQRRQRSTIEKVFLISDESVISYIFRGV